MYANRYAPRRVNKGSLTLSVAIVGVLVATAMLSPTVIGVLHHEKELHFIDVAPPPPPPPPDPTPPPRQRLEPRPAQIDPPIPIVPPPLASDFTVPHDPVAPVAPLAGTGPGEDVAIDPPKPPPVLVGAQPDARYLSDFQPTYPAEERRAGREGVVTLRVLVGIDGRVTDVEEIAAPSDAFWRVTEQRARTKWRFRPATRDGIPYAAWRQMTVRFRIEGEE
ncbi:energy transducer TonB [Sphingomonas sp.]|uniref:energy transducer TonB n=1 Tax=Sphingomonas sp. TaxID=28214 RepID=UPI003CC6801C